MDGIQLVAARRIEYDQILAEAISAYDVSDTEEQSHLAAVIRQTIEGRRNLRELETSIIAKRVYEDFILSGLIRPYDTSHLTTDGSRRVTWGSIAEKYPNPEFFESRFRFRPAELRTLIQALKIPETYRAKTYRTTDIEGLLLTLRRLAGGVRFSDLSFEFDRTEQELSAIFYTTIMMIDSGLSTLYSLNHEIFSQENLRYWSDRVEEVTQIRGLGVSCFIDGNITNISRPVRSQRLMYSGKSKTHAIKHLGLVTPSGITFLVGPEIGSRHDSGIANNHSIPDQVERVFGQFRIYADQGFALSRNIITPYRSQNRTDLDWNNQMAKGRIANEWWFGMQKQTWRFLGDKRNLKVLQGPIGAYYGVATHLLNILTCIRGRNQISDHFSSDVPSLTSYMRSFN